MTSERKELLLLGLTFALFASGVFVASLRDIGRLGGVLILSAGILAMWRRNELAAAQNRVSATRWRFLIGGGAMVARPQLFLLWGLAVVAVGIGFLIAG